MDSKEHLADLQQLGAAAFEKHEIRSETYWDEGRGARWLIGRPRTSVYLAEVIAGASGSLIVHGDIDLARFASYSDHPDAWSRLLWMARCRDVGYYVDQKASIGMGRQHRDGYDSDVALHDLTARIDDEREAEGSEELIRVLTEARAHVEHEYELRQFLYQEGSRWDLWELEIGRVVPAHVVYAHEALKRTADLLRERHGDVGPTVCSRLRADALRQKRGAA